MKCGYFAYSEHTTFVRYDCRYFGFSASTEKCLCSGCHLNNAGIPHNTGLKKWNCPQNIQKCYWHKKNNPCENCEYEGENNDKMGTMEKK